MSVRVATLNIWNRLGPWEERLAAIRAAAKFEAADVLCLQEVVVTEGFDQAWLVGDGLGYEHIVYGRHGAAQFPIGNAILSRFPSIRHEVLDLPAGNSIERRSLVYAELDAPFGRVPVFVTHLNWRLDDGDVRELQVRFIADAVDRLCPKGGFPAILAGDFNAEPDADEIRFLRGLTGLGGSRVYLTDAWAYAGKGPGVTFARRNPFAAPMREPDRRIDYIFVRGPDERGRGEPLDARVAFDVEYQGVYPSDHFGVVVTLST